MQNPHVILSEQSEREDLKTIVIADSHTPVGR